MSQRVRYIAAVAFVALITLLVFADAVFHPEGDWGVFDDMLIVAVFAAFFLVGLLVGRWWVLPLLLVPVVLTVPLGENPNDHDHWDYWYMLFLWFVIPGSPLTLAGYLVRKVADYWPRLRSGLAS